MERRVGRLDSRLEPTNVGRRARDVAIVGINIIIDLILEALDTVCASLLVLQTRASCIT